MEEIASLNSSKENKVVNAEVHPLKTPIPVYCDVLVKRALILGIVKTLL